MFKLKCKLQLVLLGCLQTYASNATSIKNKTPRIIHDLILDEPGLYY